MMMMREHLELELYLIRRMDNNNRKTSSKHFKEKVLACKINHINNSNNNNKTLVRVLSIKTMKWTLN